MRFAQHALLSVEGLIDKMTNIYSLNPRFILPFVFVLALSLLFLLPSVAGSKHRKLSSSLLTLRMVQARWRTFTASDPEGATAHRLVADYGWS